MKVAVETTGGLVVLSESFGHSVFKDSFKRVFEDGEQSLGLCFKYVSALLLCQYFAIISSVELVLLDKEYFWQLRSFLVEHYA